MKMMMRFLQLAILFWLALSVSAFADGGEQYRLQQGDAVMISVWGEASLQKEVKVLPDGSVTFPLAGRVEVGGLTTPEAEKQISEKLKKYLPEPQVTVVVTAIEGSRVYILGKVARPGPVPVFGPLTVLQAISIAGGVDKFADQRGVKVIRSGASGQKVMPLDYGKLLEGQELDKNYQLKSGDVIVVP